MGTIMKVKTLPMNYFPSLWKDRQKHLENLDQVLTRLRTLVLMDAVC